MGILVSRALENRTKVKSNDFVTQGKVSKDFTCVLALLLRLRPACNHPYIVLAEELSKDWQVLKDKNKLYEAFMSCGGSSQRYVEKVLKDVEDGTLEKRHVRPICLECSEDAVAPKECGNPACRRCIMSLVYRGHKYPICCGPNSIDTMLTLPTRS